MPCTFVTNIVKPNIIPRRINRKMLKIMEKFYISSPSGRK